jgi:hypothetical protein
MLSSIRLPEIPGAERCRLVERHLRSHQGIAPPSVQPQPAGSRFKGYRGLRARLESCDTHDPLGTREMLSIQSAARSSIEPVTSDQCRGLCAVIKKQQLIVSRRWL